ncbi:TolC family protein [Caldalkalibacillus mannanilyticus]|uniref:TolC family protein n=1 Tax=Caldalkalibacillus mannanilyticus TaxID=1418 RepID=UPI00046899DD|nr:TolC family protein [Caldalkalibacillus mannanilyticus]
MNNKRFNQWVILYTITALIFGTFLVTLATPGEVVASTTNQEDKKEEENKEKEEENLTLDLERVLKLGLEDNFNLMLIQYQVEEMRYQVLDQIRAADQLTGTGPGNLLPIVKCEPPADDKDEEGKKAFEECEKKNETNRKINKNIEASFEAEVQSQRRQIENLAQDMLYNERRSTFEMEDTKEKIRLNLIESYINLDVLKASAELQKENVELLKKDYELKKIQHSHGTVSKRELRKAEQELQKATQQSADMELNHKRSVRKLLWNLNLDPKKEYTFVPVEKIENKEYEIPSNIKELIEKTNAIQLAQEKLTKAKRDQANAESQLYRDHELKQRAKKQAEDKLKIEEQSIKQLELDIELKIIETFEKANELYDQYAEMEEKLEDLLEEYEVNQTLFEKGFVSKQKLDQLKISVKAN